MGRNFFYIKISTLIRYDSFYVVDFGFSDAGAAGLHARPSAGRPESKMAGAVVSKASQAGQ